MDALRVAGRIEAELDELCRHFAQASGGSRRVVDDRLSPVRLAMVARQHVAQLRVRPVHAPGEAIALGFSEVQYDYVRFPDEKRIVTEATFGGKKR